MFIQRLKVKDIAEFVSGLDFDFISVNLCNYTKEPYIRIFFDKKSILNKNTININPRLYDFKAIGINRNWQEFLYKKFGEEYKREYRKYLSIKRNCKLNEISL